MDYSTADIQPPFPSTIDMDTDIASATLQAKENELNTHENFVHAFVTQDTIITLEHCTNASL